MAQFTQETIKKVNHKDSEDIRGLTEKSTKVSGSMDSKMVQVFGEARKEIHTSVSGKMAKQMDTESILGLMVIAIKANSRAV